MIKNIKSYSIVNSFSVIMTLMITLVSFGIFSVFTIYQINKSLKDLNLKANKSISDLSKIIDQPLWNVENNTLIIIGDAFVQDKYICKLEIFNNNNKTIYQYIKNNVNEDIKKEEKVIHSGQEIGKVILNYSYNSLFIDYLPQSIAIILINIILVLLVIVISNILTKKLFIKPLSEISKAISKYEHGNYLVEIDNIEVVEFKELVTLLSKMSQKILSQIDELQLINKNYEKQSLEKDTLLKEIHHRVKNNMQIVISLIHLQLKKINDKHDVEMINDLANRIQSMSLVHQLLYESNDFSSINFNQYIKFLTDNIIINSPCNKRIMIKNDFDDVRLTIEKAIPCGLIINEIITNSIKHAFQDSSDKSPEISISIKNKENNIIFMIIQDNGIGISSDIDTLNNTSMGLTLINNLTKQINGDVKFQNDNGTKILLSFNNE